MMCVILAQVAGMAPLSTLCCHVCCHLLLLMHMRQCQCSSMYWHPEALPPLPSLFTGPPAGRGRVPANCWAAVSTA